MLLLTLIGLAGCATPTGTADRGSSIVVAQEPGPSGGTGRDPAFGSPASATPMLINGRPVTRERLWPLLAEASGAQVVEEVALDLLLERELERRGIELTDAMIRAERERLLGSLGGGEGPGVIERVRRRRGLGPERLEGLLERNAALRALTRDRVEVGEDEIRLAHRVTHGPKIEARVIVRPTQREAADERRRLEGAGLDAFIRAAMDRSVDPTASVGGLLEPISPSDPAYSTAVRAVLSELEPGELSRVVALDQGYAVFRAERRVPADGVAMEDVRAEIASRLRARKQRLEMERLARDLLGGADVNVLDQSLGWGGQR